MAEKNTHGEYNRRLIRDAFQTKDAANNAKKPTGIRSKAMDPDVRRELQTSLVEGSKAVKRTTNAQRKVDNLQNEREQLIAKRDKANASTAAAAEKRIGKQSGITPSKQSRKPEIATSTPKRTTQTTISREKMGNGPTGNIVKREEPKYNQAREDAQRRAREAAMSARRGR
jgi:hypothetical protein